MMNRIIRIFVLVFLLNPMLSFSQETKGIVKTIDNISGQYAECASYYVLVYHATNSSNEKETAISYGKLQENAVFYSLILAREGRSNDVAVEVTYSRIEMYMKKMKQEAGNKNENISILINKYHFGCQDLMENPPNQVLKYLKSKPEPINKQKGTN